MVMSRHTHRVKTVAEHSQQRFTQAALDIEQNILATVRALRTRHPRESGCSDREH
jgi:hypothetical protein